MSQKAKQSEGLKEYWRRLKANPEAYARRKKRPAGDVKARFWKKVDCSSEDGCWEWQACKNPYGYGIFQLNNKACKAHRVAYGLEHGPIDDEDCVLHRCDNRGCVRPDHLFLGSKTDNAADRDQKGRQAKGVKAAKAKLDEAKVRAIRTMYATGQFSQQELADAFGVYQGTVGAIIRHKTWKHVL